MASLDMTDTIVLYVNTLLSSAFICLTLLQLKKHGSFYLYLITNIFFVATNGIGIPFVKYASENLGLFYGENESWTAFLVNCIFIFFTSGIHLFVYRSDFFRLLNSSKPNQLIRNYKRTPTLFFWFFFTISLIGFIYFFFISGGYSYLGTIFVASSRDEYYANRILVGSEISNLPGSLLAFISTTTINPTLMVLIIYFERGNKRLKNLLSKISYWIMIIILSISTTLISLVFARRFMVIFSLLFPLLIIGVRFLKNETLDINYIQKKIFNNFQRLIVGLIALLFSISFIFSTVGQEDFSTSFTSLIERVVLVPPGTNNYYYYIFPSKLQFRGLEKVGKMGSPESGDVTFQDIGLMAVGRPLTANVNFLTVSYSAGGFLGVLFMMFIYTVVSIFNDFLFAKADGQLKTLLFVTNFYGIIMLGSVPLQTAISTFGFVTSTFMVSLCLRSRRH